eukprot:gene22245-1308_t
MENKADKRIEDLEGVNKRLDETLASLEKDKCCMYMICLMLVLACLGFLVYELTGKK